MCGRADPMRGPSKPLRSPFPEGYREAFGKAFPVEFRILGGGIPAEERLHVDGAASTSASTTVVQPLRNRWQTGSKWVAIAMRSIGGAA